MNIGDKFGRLTFIGEADGKINNRGHKLAHGLFMCECGNECVCDLHRVKSGVKKSCGCLRNEIAGDRFRVHGLAHNYVHKAYKGVKTRCFNPNSVQYENYGGRGITMCEEWKSDFKKFYEWAMKNGWEEGLHLDRIDNDGNYEPNNCRFVEPKENNAIGRQRKRKDNTSGWVGVYKTHSNRWMAGIQINKKPYYIGTYETVEEAVMARINYEILHLGEQKTNLDFKATLD
jgi:hypothetical protein